MLLRAAALLPSVLQCSSGLVPVATASLILSVFPAVCAAQQATSIPRSVRQGMFSAVPVGVVATPDGGSRELLITDPGAVSGAPEPWSTARFGSAGANYPDFSMAALFGALAPVVELTGISTGNDLMPLTTSDGTMIMNSQWFTLTVSVTNEALGQSNSHVDFVVRSGDSPGSELFTYYTIGSVGIDPALVNTNHSERSREQLGLSAATAPPEDRPDVGALDFGMGVIAFDRDQRSAAMFPTRNRFYFTVSPDCAPLLGPDFAIDPSLPPGSNAVPANAATIYACEWDLSATGWSWGRPRIYRSPQVLGLDPSSDRIDAIGVSTPQDAVIFSTQVVPGRSQIQVMQPSQNTPQALKAPDGVWVTDRLGIRSTEPDDVDGTCGIDPFVAPCGGGVVGTPATSLTSSPLGLSVVRSKSGPEGDDLIYVQVTGLPTTVADAFVMLCTADFAPVGPRPLHEDWVLLGINEVARGQAQSTFILPAAALGCNTAFMAKFVSNAPIQLGDNELPGEVGGGFGTIGGSPVTITSLIGILDLKK